MQDAGTVLEVLRERGRKGLPLTQLYRQMFNKNMYLLFVDRTSGRHAGMVDALAVSSMPAALRRNGWGLVPVVVALCDRSWLRACCSGFLRDG